MKRLVGLGPIAFLSISLVVSAGVGLGLSRRNPDLLDGVPVGTSLEPSPAFGLGSEVAPGRVETSGLTVLTLSRGGQPITIRSVELEGHQIRLAAVGLMGPSRKVYQFVSAPGFPSHFGRGSVPAEGAVVRAAPRGYQLLLGLVGSGDGFLVSHWLDVRYESGGKMFVQRIPQTIVLCSSHSLLRQGTCQPPPWLG